MHAKRLFDLAAENAGKLSFQRQPLALIAAVGEIAACIALPASVEIDVNDESALLKAVGKTALVAITTAYENDGYYPALYLLEDNLEFWERTEKQSAEDWLVEIALHASDIAAGLTEQGSVAWEVQEILNKLSLILLCLGSDADIAECFSLYLDNSA